MRDPQRWLERTELPEDLRRALEAEKQVAPPAGAQDKVLASLLVAAAAAQAAGAASSAAASGAATSSAASSSAVASGVATSGVAASGATVSASLAPGAAATTAAGAGAAAASGGGVALGTKLIVLAVAGSGALAGGGALYRAEVAEQASQARPSMVVVAAPTAEAGAETGAGTETETEAEIGAETETETGAGTETEAETETETGARAETGAENETGARAETAVPAVRLVPSVVAARVEREAASVELIPSEAALVTQARARLRAGDFPGTLALVEELGRLHPYGTLGQERAMLAIRALQGHGQQEQARERAAAFMRRYPSSPYARTLRQDFPEHAPRIPDAVDP